MATPILQAVPGNFNFTPGIIPPSPGDLEEARIKRLIDLARLKQLQQDPLIQQQQLQLQRQATGETGRHNVATEAESNAQLAEAVRQHHVDALLRQSGLDVEQRGQDISARGQDVTVRGQDIGLQADRERIAAAKEQSKTASETQLTDTLISHFLSGVSNDPAGDKQNLAKILALRGHPEMLKVLGEKPAGTGDPLADATLEYMKNKKQGATTTSPNTGTSSITDILKSLFVLPGLR